MRNPYIIYIASFLFSFSLYLLGWSDIYPEITIALVIFFIITFFVSMYLGLKIKNSILLKYTKIEYGLKIYWLTGLACAGWIADIAYSGSIPILNILSGSKYSYNESSGIPTFHVVLTSFQLFFCVYLFHVFLSTKHSKVLYLYILNVLPFIITFTRSALLIVIIAPLLIYISSISGNLLSDTAKKFLFKIVPIALTVLLIFGSLGNIRSTSQAGGDADAGTGIIFIIGEANSRFYTSGVPQDFFWSYIYISSPLANLQHNINMTNNNYPNLSNISSFFVNELMPDFISKRISETFNIIPTDPFLITPTLTVGTVYAGSVYHLSWMGIIIMSIFIMTFPMLYLKLLAKNSGLSVTGMAILNTIYSLLIFDNMFKVSGVSMTLVFPIFLAEFLCPQLNKANLT